MHIGIDATCWTNVRGYGRHARSLLGALLEIDSEHRYTFVVDWEEDAEVPPLPEVVEIVRVATRTPTTEAAVAGSNRRIADLARMRRALSDPSFDIVLFPTVYSFTPVLGPARVVVMIHDVIAEVHPELVFPGIRDRTLWHLKSALARRQADRILTVSRYSQERLVEHFGFSADEVGVVGEAPDPVFRTLDAPEPTSRLRELGLGDLGKEGAPHRVVFVGGLTPHKNLPTLLDAFARIVAREEHGEVELLLVGAAAEGAFHQHVDELERQIETLELGSRVRFTGFLPDDDLVVLLNLATLLVLPSFMEGFGLPGVEAAACSCPVIATRESPLPELLHGAGLFVDPRDPSGLEEALVVLLESAELRARLGDAGAAAASELSWHREAERLRRALTAAGA